MSASSPPEKGFSSSLDFLRGGGEMGERIRTFDWTKTSLGSFEQWSPALRTLVGILLVNRFPLLLWWGPSYVSLYNDAYAPILGAKHPTQALGLPVSKCWAEIWTFLKPLIDTPFSGGESTWMEDMELELNRHGFLEEAHFTVAYSPVPDETAKGGIGGVLATVHEITEKIIGERRARILRELDVSLAAGATAEASCAKAAHTLAFHTKDIPFGCIYLIDPGTTQAKRAGLCGVAAEEGLFPVAVDLSGDEMSGWRLAETRQTDKMQVVSDLANRFPTTNPTRWKDANTAAVVPIRSNKAGELAGLLVVGLSGRQKFADLYQDFVQSISSHLATTIGNHRALREERDRAEALAEIDRAKTTFFSNVSHEFRTPLTLILGPLEELRTRASESPALVERGEIEVVHRNSLRLLKLVNTLLDFSRVEADRAQAAFGETDLAQLTAELGSAFVSAMAKAELAFSINCPSLPEAVFVDADLWEKIVFNLLSNALKYTLTGEVCLTVRADNGHAVISVRDTGLGIAAAELPNLFKRFHRIENVRGRTHEGTGIGLALVQELVKLHGGTIEVESEPRRGTEFRVRVPFGKQHLPSDRIVSGVAIRRGPSPKDLFVQEVLGWLPEKSAPVTGLTNALDYPASAFPGAQRPRILLAEDNADMREYVRRILKEHYEVEAVADGAAALAAARRDAPDLVLSDVMMPAMNGIELVQRLRADDRLRHLPIILLSARAGEEARVEGASHDADDYLTKPFSARELFARVAVHLKLARVRREASAVVRDSEAQLAAATAAGAVGTWAWDLGSNVVSANPAFARAFGMDVEQVRRGLSADAYIAAILTEDQPAVKKAIARATAPDSDGVYEVEYRTRDVEGNVRWLSARGRVEFDAGRKPLRMPGALTDITGRKQAEEALRMAKERAEAANRSKDEFLAALSHELRTPLTPVLVTAATLKDDPRLPDDIREQLGMIERNIALEARLIDDLLDLTAISHGKLKMRLDRCDLNVIVERAIEMVTPDSNAKNLVISREFSATQPVLMADPTRLQQVVWNLLRNAVKFTPSGGKIFVRTRETLNTDGKPWLTLEVADTGIGIHADHLVHIFRPFDQGPLSGNHRFGGLGLGLTIAQALVIAHGGRMEAQSEGTGKGATFVVNLPKVLVAESAVKGIPSNAQRLPTSMIPLRLLLVEDHGATLQTLAKLLKRDGHQVETAETVAQAMIAAAHGTFDLVISDLGLPDGSGSEMMDQLRTLHGLRGIALSGYGMEEDIARSRAAGFVAHLVKPVAISDLRRALADISQPNSSD